MAKFGSDSKFGTGKDETDEVSEKVSEFLNQYDEIIVEGDLEEASFRQGLGYQKTIINAEGRDNVFAKVQTLYKSKSKQRVFAVTDGEQEGINGIVKTLNERGIPVKRKNPPLIRVNDYIDILVMGLPEDYRGCTDSVIGQGLLNKAIEDCETVKDELRKYVCGGPCKNDEVFIDRLFDDNNEYKPKAKGSLEAYISRIIEEYANDSRGHGKGRK